MEQLLIFGIIILVAGLVAVISFIIYRRLHPKLKEEPRDEARDVEESLDRVLVPVEDEETARAISEYQDDENE